MKTILIVEDEPGLQLGLTELFHLAGYKTETAELGAEVIPRIESGHVDLVLLDLGLPDVDGTIVLKALNEHFPQLPVLVLTARGEEADIVLGFHLGAMDYVVKPYSPRILLARVEALWRRVPEMDAIKLGRVTLDFDRMEAKSDHGPIALSAKEFDVLRCLSRADGAPMTRMDLLDQVWGMDSDAGARTVDTVIAQIRKKIEPDPSNPVYLRSQHGVGYKLVKP